MNAHSHYIPYPSANVKKHQDFFDLELAVPGFKKEELEIILFHGVLRVKGEKAVERVTDGTQFIRKEHDLESFEREFELGEDADEERIDAKYEEGMLKIRLYRKNEGKEDAVNRREIEIS